MREEPTKDGICVTNTCVWGVARETWLTHLWHLEAYYDACISSLKQDTCAALLVTAQLCRDVYGTTVHMSVVTT